MARQTTSLFEYNKTKNIRIITLITSLLIVFFIITAAYSSLTCDKLTCVHIDNMSDWKEKEIYEYTDSTYRALFVRDDDMMRIEKNSHMNKNDADLLSKVTTMKITGLFDDARSPYPGMISDRIKCDEQYKPKIQQLQNNGLNITYFIAGLNNRLQYGSCIDQQLPYVAFNALFYCPNQKARYHVEFITPRKNTSGETYKSAIEHIRCAGGPLRK